MPTGLNQPFTMPQYGRGVFNSQGQLQGFQSPAPVPGVIQQPSMSPPMQQYGGGMMQGQGMGGNMMPQYSNGMGYGGGMMQQPSMQQSGMGGYGGGFMQTGMMQPTVITAQVSYGDPIIFNPETGKPYPPGYVPEVTAPGYHDNTMPGDKMREAFEEGSARLKDLMRQTGVAITGPLEQKLHDQIQKQLDLYENKALPQAQKLGQSLAGNPIGTAKNLSNQAPRVINNGAATAGSTVRQIQTQGGNVARELPRLGGSAAKTVSGAANSLSQGYQGNYSPSLSGGGVYRK